MPSEKAISIISDVFSNSMESHSLETFVNYISAATKLPDEQIQSAWDMYWKIPVELRCDYDNKEWRELIRIAAIRVIPNQDKVKIVSWLAATLKLNGYSLNSMVDKYAHLYHKFRACTLAAGNPEKYIDRISPEAIHQLGEIIGYDIKYGYSTTKAEEVKA